MINLLTKISLCAFMAITFSCASLKPQTIALTDIPGALFTKPAGEWENTLYWASTGFLSSRLNTKILTEAGYDQWRLSRLGSLRDVQGFRVEFGTPLMPQGPIDRQSGLLLLPAATKNSKQDLTWIIWTRGTELVRDWAPSKYAGYEILFPSVLASLGFAVWMPDYAGFGSSRGVQTYCVPESQALSAIGGLQAARDLIASLGEYYSETGRLSIIGYSQGGQAAMATAKAISQNPGDIHGLNLKDVYALGAPLDLMIGAGESFDTSQTLARPEYSFYLVLGWARAFPEEIKPQEILNPQLLEKVGPLFDGTRENTILHELIAGAVGKAKGQVTYNDLFRADYLESVKSKPETVAYYKLQKQSRLDQWVPPPEVTLNLAATMADKVVSPQNSLGAQKYILSNSPNSKVTFTELFSPDHVTAGGEAMLWAVLSVDKSEKLLK